MQDVRDQIAAILGAVEGIGRVHTFQRWSSEWDRYLDLFKTTDADEKTRISGLVITRSATARRELTSNQIQRVHVFKLFFLLGCKDDEATELKFQNLLDSVAEVLDAHYTLNGTCETTTPEWGPGAGLAGMQIDEVDLRLFGGVLCHTAVCRLGVQEEPADV